MSKIYVSQESCNKWIKDIVATGSTYDVIVSINQGGAVLANGLGLLMNRPVISYTKECLVSIQAEDRVLIVDDLISTGATMSQAVDEVSKYTKKIGVAVMFDSGNTEMLSCCTFEGTPTELSTEDWIDFWWESKAEGTAGVQDNITRILDYIGEDPKREGLVDTPKRVMNSYAKLFGGYKENPADIMVTFEEGSCKEMVILKDIEFYSTCEHHMIPFMGKASIAYIPNGKVIGVSKLARLLEIFARRLQIQERIGQQVVEELVKHLSPLGAACVIEAQHLCMTARGVEKQKSVMVTSSLHGVFQEESSARQELMTLLKG